MAVISTLSVNLVARTSVFQKKLRQSRRSLRNFSRSVGKILKPLARIGIVGVAAATGLAYLIKKEMDVIDVTGKLARRIGVTTERLVGLQHAAQISGVSSEILNKAMETFVRRLGEVRMGVGQAKYALDAMGISADELVKKSPVDAFYLIADRINKIETNADRAASAYYLMGRQGMTMLNMMQLGSKGLIKLQREAERLGLTFTMKQALRVEAANDALTRMKGVLTGLIRTLAIEFSPLVAELADKFTNWATAGEGGANRIRTSLGSLSLALFDIGDTLDELKLKWMAFKLGAMESGGGILKASPLYNLYSMMTARQRAEERSFLEKSIEAGYAGLMSKKAKRIRNWYANYIKSPAGTTPGIAGTAKDAEEQANAMKRLVTEADRLKLSLRSPLQILKDFTLELQRMYDIGALSLSQVGLLMHRRARELWDFTREIKTKVAPEEQYRFVGGQGRQFDPRNFLPGANMAAGSWLKIQSPEVKELQEQTVVLKLSNQKLDMMLDVLRRNIWG